LARDNLEPTRQLADKELPGLPGFVSKESW
jgi:hypothetical protein